MSEKPEFPPTVMADLPELVEPTRDEKKNGYTKESLTRYLKQRQLQQQQWALGFDRYGVKRPRKVTVENYDNFCPHRWNPGGSYEA